MSSFKCGMVSLDCFILSATGTADPFFFVTLPNHKFYSIKKTGEGAVLPCLEPWVLVGVQVCDQSI